jgi:hypothetical protein
MTETLEAVVRNGDHHHEIPQKIKDRLLIRRATGYAGPAKAPTVSESTQKEKRTLGSLIGKFNGIHKQQSFDHLLGEDRIPSQKNL